MKTKHLLKILYWILICGVVAITISLSMSLLYPTIGLNIASVQSGSMQPEIKTGDAVVIVSQNDYEVGDIVTFKGKDSERNKFTTTHRIVGQTHTETNIFYYTKGDANPDEDSDTLEKTQIVGKVIFAIPYLGYLLNFAKTLPGLLVLIIIPSSLIVFSEMVNIKKEIESKLGEKNFQI